MFSVVEGEGESTIAGKAFPWKKRDHFVVPSWEKHVHEASRDAVLFSYSDRGVQEKLGFFREQRLDA